MGRITILNSVTGVLGSQRSFTATTTREVSDCVDTMFLADNSWMDVIGTGAGGSYITILINTGDNPAVFRVRTGSNYTRFNLPAGAAVVVPMTSYFPLGTEEASVASPNDYRLAVYSALGTTIRAIVAS